MRIYINGNWGDSPDSDITFSNDNYVAPNPATDVGIYMKKLIRKQLRENLESDKRKKAKK